eukprot:scaffold2572_cov391-Prasinococcus_capsulatus_cf.AAC.11
MAPYAQARAGALSSNDQSYLVLGRCGEPGRVSCPTAFPTQQATSESRQDALNRVAGAGTRLCTAAGLPTWSARAPAPQASARPRPPPLPKGDGGAGGCRPSPLAAPIDQSISRTGRADDAYASDGGWMDGCP